MSHLEFKGNTVLYRPVGPEELQLIRQSGYRAFPPRLPHQSIFYPVLNEEYASQIARDWNAANPAIGSGYVMRFQVRNAYIARFPIRKAGGSIHEEYWIPAEELADFNANIVGLIEIVAEFHYK
jgi:hypothetical protein